MAIIIIKLQHQKIFINIESASAGNPDYNTKNCKDTNIQDDCSKQMQHRFNQVAPEEEFLYCLDLDR